MKVKTVLSFFLFVFFFVSGNIILFGILEEGSFFGVYFFFGFIFMIFFSFLIWDRFQDKSDFFFLLVFLILLLFPVSYYAANMRSYYGASVEMNMVRDDLVNELGTITDLNNYYLDYITYLESQISYYQNDSAELEARISEINSQVEQIQEEELVYTVEDYEREHEEHEEEYEDD